MGIFWPPENPTNVLRLTGLVCAVAGVCAISDRSSRYSLLKYLYTQLKKLDEDSAWQIEHTTTRHLSSLAASDNARDTRSYASDSTAFSRASTPPADPHRAPADTVLRHVFLTENAVTQPSSAQCNTPEGFSQLDAALDRLKGSEAKDYEAAGAVDASNVLMPLTVMPATMVDSTPAVLSKAEKLDKAGRLQPLPNPSAPKIKPSHVDGKPQLFDYIPPTPTTPSVIASPAPRRVRAHVEIETTEHDSYGFVSNPSAFVAAPSTVSPKQIGRPSGDHYLFVCVKCQRRSTNEVCEKVCSDEDGVLRCKLQPRNGMELEDLEDLVMPMTPRVSTDGRKKTTGRMLYENLQALHTQHERLRARAACHGSAPHTHETKSSLDCPNSVQSRLRIVPVNCLSMCHLGNVIAMSAPGKFGYQFGAMREDDSEDMQAILQFAEDYIESDEGFTKNKTRPPRLSRNILARIPPSLPAFTTLAG